VKMGARFRNDFRADADEVRTFNWPGCGRFMVGSLRCAAALALALLLCHCGRKGGAPNAGAAPPRGGEPWRNSLGMSFVPVPGTRVLFSVYETRAGEFEQFVNETQTEWVPPAVESSPEHAAVNVTWVDAVAFCEWLTQRERVARVLMAQQRYRLPTEAEWALAAEAAAHEFPWGDAWPPPAGAGNFSGEESPVDQSDSDTFVNGYTDAFSRLAPVGKFSPNRFGIHDLAGNAMELCSDWFDPSHRGRVARGGSWLSGSRRTLASDYRMEMPPRAGLDVVGFRVVMDTGG
jgi:hypothetical protein